MRLILVRHGETPSNLLGSLDTDHPGPGLTDLGHDQARALVSALDGEPIDRLGVSTLVRTHLTAAPLAAARGLEPVVHDGLREIRAGDLEGRTDERAVRAYVAAVRAWHSGDLDPRVPGAENGHEVLARVDEVVEQHEDVDTATLVSHGGLIWFWAGHRGRNVDPDFLAHRHPVNTGIVVLEGSMRDGWDVVTWMGESLSRAAAEGAARDRSPATHLDD